MLFSSPELKKMLCAIVITFLLLSVRPLTFSNDFSSEASEPILLKFHMEPPKVGGTKDCLNGRGPLTKMAAMPIYGKNL